MNLRLVTFLLVTIAFQQSQSRHLHSRFHRQKKGDSYYDIVAAESREVQQDFTKNMKSPPLEVIPEDRFGAGNVISTQCHYGTVVINGNITCKEKPGRVSSKTRRNPVFFKGQVDI
ncbi:unnamed protein product [Allacma fusca]|uniref:Uncharacterized protein n=1 Tax=Allacma fusca TaxID=39272 RepID=A0A8J2JWL9_9HEXA|nr:unnamed protein product [Allacma fusca]